MIPQVAEVAGIQLEIAASEQPVEVAALGGKRTL
jgi:hypothetical protein